MKNPTITFEYEENISEDISSFLPTTCIPDCSIYLPFETNCKAININPSISNLSSTGSQISIITVPEG